jgi:hypothetical protein
MGVIQDHKNLKSNNNIYTVFSIINRGKAVPVIVDYKDYKYISSLNKSWYLNEYGSVVCQHQHNGNTIELYLHEIVMALKHKELNINTEKKPILHINRVGNDNRRENLMYDLINKDINKNLKKKKRIITLPRNSKINPNNIPTYIWYMKPDDTHGDRFIVDIGDISWKTTSSTKYSLKYKLEEAKKFLRELELIKPELFEEYSMNGEFNSGGKKMLNSFHKLIQEGGFISYSNSNKFKNNNLTDKYLKEDLSGLSQDEISDLNAFSIYDIFMK